MSLILGQVTKAFVGIKQKVFTPPIGYSFNFDLAALKTNHFVDDPAQFSPLTERNQWFPLDCRLELLQYLNFGIGGIEDGMAAFANHVYRLPERTEDNRS